MRKIELQTVEGINVVCIDGEPTSLQYTKDDMNFMLDDLAASYPSRTRSEMLAELIERACSKTNLPDGPLTGDELKKAISLVSKSCKTGWF
jgi:hypothetical protein